MIEESDNNRRRWGAFPGGRFTGVGFLAYIAAAVVFILVAFGITVGGLTELEEVAVGLALFALGHVLPG